MLGYLWQRIIVLDWLKEGEMFWYHIPRILTVPYSGEEEALIDK